MNAADYINALATALTAIVAYILYKLKERSEKRGCAQIIIHDIFRAEEIISDILRSGVSHKTPDIIYENNWSKYRHKFIANLSYDEFARINKFFDSCVSINASTDFVRNAFYYNVTSKITAIHAKLSDFDAGAGVEVDQLKRMYTKRMESEPYVFNPGTPIDDIKIYVSGVRFLSGTVEFSKLKKVAGI